MFDFESLPILKVYQKCVNTRMCLELELKRITLTFLDHLQFKLLELKSFSTIASSLTRLVHLKNHQIKEKKKTHLISVDVVNIGGEKLVNIKEKKLIKC